MSSVNNSQKKDVDQIEGPWSPEEDEMLLNFFRKHGPHYWSLISKSIPSRSGKSCRLRWLSLQRSFTPEEDEMLENLIEKHGPNWSLIGMSIPGKSAVTCELRWETIWSPYQSYIDNPTLKWKSSSMTNEDLKKGAHNINIPPPSFSDMARYNVSRPSGGTHSFTRDKSAPSWNALNKRDLSPITNDSGNVQEFVGDEFGWIDFSEVSSTSISQGEGHYKESVDNFAFDWLHF